ncbi:hypothetical protein PoB_001425500 [Plakobranchus ocellatus]|uniref:Uncharacterized protein n=1 Tax=Plakobranchus ocellatus TaxID=259542 RepID=A0AAV3YXY5_9GAST|nr:hypothetical protein PoB_001425500 [Plakobranchus ocellatus]
MLRQSMAETINNSYDIQLCATKRNKQQARVRSGFCIQPVHNKVISGFQALRQAGAPVAGLELAIEGFLHISERFLYPSVPHKRGMRSLQSLGVEII